MREIKFRAWDKSRNRFHSFEESKFHIVIMLNGELRIQNGSGSSSNFNIDNFILIQFTGLLDKNGKEIYEGDIVKTMFRYSEDKENKPPKNKTKFVVEFKINSYTQYCGFSFFPSVFETLEVIGNIYEHPELLR